MSGPPIPVLDWLLFTVPTMIGMSLPPRGSGYRRMVGRGVMSTFPMVAEYSFGWQQYGHGDTFQTLSLVVPMFLVGLLLGLGFGLPCALLRSRGGSEGT